MATGTVTGILLAKEKRKLQVLQATTRDSLGLPRASGEHPAAKFLKMQLAYILLIFLSQIPQSLMMGYLWEGTLNEFPNRITFPLITSVPLLVVHFALPLLLYVTDGGYRAHVRKARREPMEAVWYSWS